MTDWTIVLWNDASQILEQAGVKRNLQPSETIAPQTFFEKLRSDGNLADAAIFIANSLPRLEAMAWITKALPHAKEDHPYYRERRLLRDMAQRWVDDPDDANRRAVYELAENSDPEWPETLLGHAIFFSGGSIAPPDLEAVTIDPKVAATLASAALQSAATQDKESYDQIMEHALNLGHAVATNGRQALAQK